MADVSLSSPSLSHLISSAFTPFRLIVEALAAVPVMSARAREAEQLMHLSDDQLAARGLSRDGIMRHVFADLFEA